jgi:NADPH:quinone reductase-like Zn-dependent oxidoreductase
MNRVRFQRRLRADLGAVFGALAAGRIDAPVAADLPLTRAGEAMRLAESGTVTGKVILTA